MAYSLERFTPDYSIFTNFKPDHLNWHRDLQDYLDAKMHLIERTKKLAVVNQQVIDFAKKNGLKMEKSEKMKVFQTFGVPGSLPVEE